VVPFIASPAVLELAQTLLYIALWGTVPFGMGCVFAATMRASGTVVVPTLLSILAIVVVAAPGAIVVSRKIGREGVWIAYPAGFCAMMALQMAFYLMVWRKQEIRRLI